MATKDIFDIQWCNSGALEAREDWLVAISMDPFKNLGKGPALTARSVISFAVNLNGIGKACYASFCEMKTILGALPRPLQMQGQLPFFGGAIQGCRAIRSFGESGGASLAVQN